MIREELKIFRGSGLDKDSSLDLMDGGDARNRHRMGFVDGNYDELTPRRVPIEKITPTLPIGSNTTIGVCKDVENEAAIVFIHNSLGNHCIIRFYRNGSQQNISYSRSEWAFNLSYPIYNARIVGTGDNAMLVWTDNYNEPRQIKIKYFTDSSSRVPDRGNSYLLKPRPTSKPTLAYISDTDKEYNWLTNSVYQFAYKYIYNDSQISRASQWSDVLYDSRSEFFDGYKTASQIVNNAIRITCTVDYDNIDFIELYARKVDVGSGAPGYWEMVEKKAATTTTITFDYYGNEQGIIQDDEDFGVLSDQVPLLARSLEVINESRVVMGGFSFGRDNLSPSVSLTQAYAVNPDETFLVNDEVNFAKIAAAGNANFDIKLDDSEENHVVIEAVIEDGSAISERETHVLRSDDGVTTTTYGSYGDNTNVINQLVSIIDTNSTIGLNASRTVGGGNDDRLNIVNGGADTVLMSTFTTTPQAKYRSMKENSTAFFAIAYYDSPGREGRCQVTPFTKVDITSRLTASSNMVDIRSVVRYAISSDAPSWATHWQMLYGGSSIPYFYYLLVSVPGPHSIFSGATPYDNTGPDVTIDGGLMKINITQAQANVYNKYGYNPATFSPAVGDFVKVRGTMVYPQTEAIKSSNEQIFPIVKVDSTSIYISGAEYLMTQQQYLIIEIFREISEIDQENIEYREVGDLLTVTHSGTRRYHNASIPSTGTYLDITSTPVVAQNQTSTDPAIGIIDFGNTYQYPLYWGYKCFEIPAVANDEFYPVITRIESMSVSLKYDSMAYGTGRSNYVDNTAANKYYNAIIYGGVFNNTSLNYNELNRFVLDDLRYVNDKHGTINAVLEKGYTLYAFQDSNVTAIEIGRKTVEQDGQYMVVSTNVVFGSPRPFPHNFGTIYPGSITQHAGYIWFYDPKNMTVYQIAQNGIEDIGARKMKSYFVELSGTMGGNFSNYDFKSLYDNRTECYVIVCLDKVTPTNSWSLSYSPALNKWQCTENYGREGGASVSDNFIVSFLDSVPYYHHESTAEYDQGAYTDVHFNNPKFETKLFRGIEVDSKYQFDAADIPSIWVGDDVIHQDDETNIYYNATQQSFIPIGFWQKSHGKWYAPFLRNILMPNGTTRSYVLSKLYGGDRLAGNSITIRLRALLSDKKTVLRSVKLKYTTKR